MNKMDRVEGKLLAGLGLISVMSLHQISSETILAVISSLSLLQLIILKIRGSVQIDRIRLEGWRMNLPFYIISCPKHGFQLSYPNGYHEVLVCPKCIESKPD